MNTKHRSKCKRDLDASEFYSNKAAADGLQNYCKSCQKARNQSSAASITPHRVTPTRDGAEYDITVFQPRQLIARLRELGYTGELQYTSKIKV